MGKNTLQIKNNRLLQEEQDILDWFENVHFKPVAFGGVQEADVYKKLEELNRLYKAAMSAERARYNALLSDRVDEFNAILRKMNEGVPEGNRNG